jgi:signal transduction histidine kinase
MSIQAKIMFPALILMLGLVSALSYMYANLNAEEKLLSAKADTVEQTYMLSQRLGKLQRDVAVSLLTFRFDRQDYQLDQLSWTESEIGDALDRLSAIELSEEGSKLLSSYLESSIGIASMQTDLIETIRESDQAEIDQAFDRWAIISELNEAELQDVSIFATNSLNQTFADVRSHRRQLGNVVMAIASFCIVTVFASGVYYRRTIIDPIAKLTDTARNITMGNFENDMKVVAKDRNDELGTLALAFHDMTDNLIEANTNLDRRVEERTSELEREIGERLEVEREILSLNENLLRSNSELEQFAYVASYDLQAPLRTVVGFSKILAEDYGDKLDDDADDLIKRITNAATRMQTLINDLLTYSRVGKNIGELGPIDSQAVLDHVVEELAVTIEETGAIVTYDALPVAMGDSVLLSQVLRNLISNAIKYCDEPYPKVHISAKREYLSWVFSVRDNGIGIDPEFSDRIFVIFQRLHNIDNYSGTGIGLAVSKKAADRMGGNIWVESEPGEGSTFYFTVPLTSVGLPPEKTEITVQEFEPLAIGGERL